MIRSLLLPGMMVLLTACGGNEAAPKVTTPVKDTTLSYFGDTIAPDNAMDVAQLMSSLKGKDSLAVKLTGKVNSVCQKKGCWMEMQVNDKQSMRVTFKDYAFFVPKDISGKTAIIDGYVHNDTISVSQLKHYAEDAGKSKEEIEKITEPEVELSFEARGVIIRNK